jgi:hypothetical protein
MTASAEPIITFSSTDPAPAPAVGHLFTEQIVHREPGGARYENTGRIFKCVSLGWEPSQSNDRVRFILDTDFHKAWRLELAHDGLTTTECFDLYQRRQRDEPVGMTAAQLLAARTEWARQLSNKP